MATLRRSLALVVGAAIWVLTASVSHAGIISVQFGSTSTQVGPAVGGSGATDVWNRFSSGTSATGLSLVDVSGGATGITLDYTSQFNIPGSGITGNFAPGYTSLASGYLAVTSTTGTVTLHGLGANTSYSLYLYSNRDNNNSQTNFSVNGSAVQTTASHGALGNFVLGSNYLIFTGTADSIGRVAINYSKGSGSSEGDLNGLQLITAASVPEPSSMVLVCLGGMTIAAFRRRTMSKRPA